MKEKKINTEKNNEQLNNVAEAKDGLQLLNNKFSICYGDYVKCKLPNRNDKITIAKYEWKTKNNLYLVNVNGIHYYLNEKNILGKANENDLLNDKKGKNNLALNVFRFLARKTKYNMPNNNNNAKNKELEMLEIVTQ